MGKAHSIRIYCYNRDPRHDEAHKNDLQELKTNPENPSMAQRVYDPLGKIFLRSIQTSVLKNKAANPVRFGEPVTSRKKKIAFVTATMHELPDCIKEILLIINLSGRSLYLDAA